MTWNRRWTLSATSLAVIPTFFVLRQHALGLAPYLLLLAFPQQTWSRLNSDDVVFPRCFNYFPRSLEAWAEDVAVACP